MTICVRDLMAQNVLTLKAGDTVSLARDLMAAHGVHALPVADASGRSLGIVTSSDLMADCPQDTPMASLMTEKLIVTSGDTDLFDASELMLSRQVHHLLVMNGEEVVGILSTFDFLKLFHDDRFVLELAESESLRRDRLEAEPLRSATTADSTGPE